LLLRSSVGSSLGKGSGHLAVTNRTELAVTRRTERLATRASHRFAGTTGSQGWYL
jgi:hypothetical protein